MSSKQDYTFPQSKLKLALKDPSKQPLVLVACGSFSPITYLHLRMFEMASDYVRLNTNFELVGCYLSPVSDAYKKKGLASAEHRMTMCELGIENAPLLMVDEWEAIEPEYTPTAQVLDHLDDELNTFRRGIRSGPDSKKEVQISLVAGADLISTFNTPGVWAEEDLFHILEQYGAFVIERSGTDLSLAVSELKQPTDKIHVITQEVTNDVSSTKIRDFVNRGLSVKYLVPPAVVEHIDKFGLYQESRKQANTGLEEEGKQ